MLSTLIRRHKRRIERVVLQRGLFGFGVVVLGLAGWFLWRLATGLQIPVAGLDGLLEARLSPGNVHPIPDPRLHGGMEERWPATALTAHDEGLRRLARSLVFSEHEAEDLVQQTYASALAHRGRRPTHEGAWLRAVLRNVASNLRRGRGRQRGRERAAARRDAVPSAADAVVQIEERELLLGAVKALERPYRDVTVLRYLDGLPPRRIAERLDCPVATVKSRLQRALARLRQRLDTDHGGDRHRWLAALAPLTLPPRIGAGHGASLLGGLAMSAATRVSILALVILLAAGGVWFGMRALEKREDPVGAEAASAGPGEGADPSLRGRGAVPADALAEDPHVGSRAVVRADGRRVYPAVREPVDLLGRVEDPRGAPLADAEIVARAVSGPQLEENAIADDRGFVRRARSDASGRFVFEGLPVGPYAIRATHGERTMDVRFVAARPGAPVLMLRLRRHASDLGFRVRTVDEEGRPVVGADVEVRGDSAWTGTTGEHAVWRGTTGEDGVAVWPDVELQGAVVWARGPAGREGLRLLWLRDAVLKAMEKGAAEVVLAPPATLEGDVGSTDGAPLTGVVVEAHARTSTEAYYTSQVRVWETPVTDGRYRFDALPAGIYHLFVRGGGLRTIVTWRSDGRFPGAVQAHLKAGARAEVDLVAARGGVVGGLVRSAGVPVAGASVRATRDPRTSNAPEGVHLYGVNVRRYDSPKLSTPDHPLTHRLVETDDTGQYVLDGLEPGRYRLDVLAQGLSHVQVLDVEVPLEETVTRDFDLVPAGVLQGTAPGAVYFGVRAVGEEDFRAIAILGPGRLFTFAGLPPGEYELGFPYWNRETLVVGRATVVAGRTTWVDLSNVGAFSLRARVVVGGAALGGADVRLGSRTVRTDATGNVELRWPDAKGPGSTPLIVHRQLPAGGVQRWWIPCTFDPGGVTDIGDLVLGEHTLSLRTTDAAGRTAAAKLVVFGGALDRPFVGETVDTIVMEVRAPTSPRGVLALTGCPAHAVYTATAAFEGEIEVKSSFAVPIAEPVVLRAPPMGSLAVDLRDAEGAPRPGIWVSVSTWVGEGAAPANLAAWQAAGDDDLLTVSEKTDEDGRVTLPHVPAGTLWVRASWRTTPWGDGTRHARAFLTLAPGEEKRLELELR